MEKSGRWRSRAAGEVGPPMCTYTIDLIIDRTKETSIPTSGCVKMAVQLLKGKLNPNDHRPNKGN